MVVDQASLAVRPVVDQLLKQAASLPGAEAAFEGESKFPNEVVLGDVAWSNELTLHVLELKTAEPASQLAGLEEVFAGHVRRINAMLQPLGCVLLPTGMHPTMDPFTEMKLWPHDYA